MIFSDSLVNYLPFQTSGDCRARSGTAATMRTGLQRVTWTVTVTVCVIEPDVAVIKTT